MTDDDDDLFRVPPSTRMTEVYRCTRFGSCAYLEVFDDRVARSAPMLARWASPGLAWPSAMAMLQFAGWTVALVTSPLSP